MFHFCSICVPLLRSIMFPLRSIYILRVVSGPVPGPPPPHPAPNLTRQPVLGPGPGTKSATGVEQKWNIGEKPRRSTKSLWNRRASETIPLVHQIHSAARCEEEWHMGVIWDPSASGILRLIVIWCTSSCNGAFSRFSSELPEAESCSHYWELVYVPSLFHVCSISVPSVCPSYVQLCSPYVQFLFCVWSQGRSPAPPTVDAHFAILPPVWMVGFIGPSRWNSFPFVPRERRVRSFQDLSELLVWVGQDLSGVSEAVLRSCHLFGRSCQNRHQAYCPLRAQSHDFTPLHSSSTSS